MLTNNGWSRVSPTLACEELMMSTATSTLPPLRLRQQLQQMLQPVQQRRQPGCPWKGTLTCAWCTDVGQYPAFLNSHPTYPLFFLERVGKKQFFDKLIVQGFLGKYFSFFVIVNLSFFYFLFFYDFLMQVILRKTGSPGDG